MTSATTSFGTAQACPRTCARRDPPDLTATSIYDSGRIDRFYLTPSYPTRPNATSRLRPAAATTGSAGISQTLMAKLEDRPSRCRVRD
jgi:hypothetical protein